VLEGTEVYEYTVAKQHHHQDVPVPSQKVSAKALFVTENQCSQFHSSSQYYVEQYLLFLGEIALNIGVYSS
jgi:hypothetical protein